MNDILTIILCGAYVGLLGVVGTIANNAWHWKSEYTRKFIHIMTANLIFPITFLIEGFWAKLFGPALFILINATFLNLGLGKYMGMTDKKRNNGLIVYPFSVLLLVFFAAMGWIRPESSLCGVLAMGWGDGVAALAGTFLGKHKYKIYGKLNKSVEGTLAMFLVVLAVVLIFSNLGVLPALLVALIASVVENLSPSGWDNFTVPVLSALVVEALCIL